MADRLTETGEKVDCYLSKSLAVSKALASGLERGQIVDYSFGLIHSLECSL